MIIKLFKTGTKPKPTKQIPNIYIKSLVLYHLTRAVPGQRARLFSVLDSILKQVQKYSKSKKGHNFYKMLDRVTYSCL